MYSRQQNPFNVLIFCEEPFIYHGINLGKMWKIEVRCRLQPFAKGNKSTATTMSHVFGHLNLIFGQFPIATAKTCCGGRCMFGYGTKPMISLKIHLPADVF